MTRLLAIDPGNTESGHVIIDTDTRRPIDFGKSANPDLIQWLPVEDVNTVHIEMIASYGMPVGATVFDTCVWIGRFAQECERSGTVVHLTKRLPIKLHHCHNPHATDAHIRQALVDRFATGQPNHGKGTKTHPGWFHGFRADIWQAYALAVFAADHNTGRGK